MNEHELLELKCLNSTYYPILLIQKLINNDPNEIESTKKEKDIYNDELLKIYNFINENKFELFDLTNKGYNLIKSKDQWLLDISISNEFDDVSVIDYNDYKEKLIKIKEKQKSLIDDYNNIFINFKSNINKNTNITFLKEIYNIIEFLKNLNSKKRNEILNYPKNNKLKQLLNKNKLKPFLDFLYKEKIKVKNINDFIKNIDNLINQLKEEELKADILQNDFIKLCREFRTQRNKIHWNKRVASNTKNNLKNYKHILKLFNMEQDRINNLNESDEFKKNKIENNEFAKSLNGFCHLLFGLLTDKQIEEIFKNNDININW